MYIKPDQVFGISFERHMHRQNAQPIYLAWKAKSNFLSYKALTVQMSITPADGAVCQLVENSTFSTVTL